MVSLHTNFGVIKLQLFADKAPLTVENFKSYVKDGFYDNTIFH
ncbi:MAG: peptidylprolyl isomerase, partial [Gammaproteobacteria bacterium]|nr:peptidylprolyl isomerase [Gammaproteobacteria bacterium]MBU2427628.1 peptidylprolyl isomerase [Gammaproteobacteria bacterium]